MLEGIGLIEKKSKNNIQWKPMAAAGNEELQRDIQALTEEIAALQVPPECLSQHCNGTLRDAVDPQACAPNWPHPRALPMSVMLSIAVTSTLKLEP